MLVYNAEENSAYLIDNAADALLSNGKIFAYSEANACILERDGEYEFRSGKLLFSAQRKVLKRIEIDCGGKVEIEVSNDVKSMIFGGQFNKICPRMSGNWFKITVRGTQEVRSVKAYAEVISGV